MKTSFFVFPPLFTFLISACVHSAFVQQDQSIIHTPTGTGFKAAEGNWLEIKDRRSENISPEILGSLDYELNIGTEEWKPSASVYILRKSSTANLDLIENRQIAANKNLQEVKSETLRINRKNKIILSTYEQPVVWTTPSGRGAKAVKTIRALNLFATSAKDSNLVVMVVIEKDSPGEKKTRPGLYSECSI